MKLYKKSSFCLKVSIGHIKHHGIESKIIPVIIAKMTKKPSF